MARVTCAISGLSFECSYFPALVISHTEGYFHPIFAAPYKHLHVLYSKHCKGELTSNDSYLLFLAFLHSSDKITWKHPAACNPNEQKTKALIENNLSQLIRVLEKTACIKYPAFKQPAFNVTYENSQLTQIVNWIKAWDDNIERFKNGRLDMKLQEELIQVENRLSYLILSGDEPEKFTSVIADWACKAAEFPTEKEEEWKKTIRSCFSMTKMFNTPLPLLKEIKEYCEANIEAGSIHFHTLSKVLKEGIAKHLDYLGGSSLALGYTLLTTSSNPASRSEFYTEEGEAYSLQAAKKAELKNTAELEALAITAPAKEPIASDYASKLDFLKARLAYRVAIQLTKKKTQGIDL